MFSRMDNSVTWEKNDIPFTSPNTSLDKGA